MWNWREHQAANVYSLFSSDSNRRIETVIDNTRVQNEKTAAAADEYRSKYSQLEKEVNEISEKVKDLNDAE